jgi:peptidoglycan/xylan/chitin deacetylase (PgdA/CDA1 family)
MPEEKAIRGQRALYLLYHELRPSPTQYSYVVAPAEFERHVDLFVQLRTAENSSLWPEVTFDDGHISNFEYALPILQSRDLKARFFITVGWTGQRQGYMGWDELRSLQESGQTIGAHGWTHTLLTHCSESELQTELGSARLTLEDKLGTSITTMSLPGGRYNKRVLAACAAAGYTQIYTSIPRSEPTVPDSLVGRLNVRGDCKPGWIADVLQPGGGILAGLERQYKVKEAAKALLGDRLYEGIWARLNRQEAEPDAAGESAE